MKLQVNLSIKQKIIGLAVLAALLPTIVMSVLTVIQKARVTPKVVEELDIIGRENITQIAKDVRAMCQTAYDLSLLEAKGTGDPAGMNQEAIASLRKAILGITVGKTGYVYVLSGHGGEKGTYIISKNGARDGENIWNAKDADGNLFIQAIVNSAVALKPGEVAYQPYPWLNQGDADARMKIAALTYFEPYDWVIGAGSYEDDYYEARNKVEAALRALLTWSLIGGGVVLAGAVAVAFAVGKRLAKPISEVARAADKLALGDLDQNIEYSSNDDVGYLAQSFREVIAGLKAKAGIATEIARGNLAVNVSALCPQDSLGTAMVTMKDSVAAMVKDMDMLVKAAVEGDLSKRADAGRHRGEFRKIVEGVNATLDAVVNPIKDTIAVLDRVADRDLVARVTGDYRGDHAQIKDAVNRTVENLSDALVQVALGTEQITAAAGQIADGSQALAQASSEQASSLQEISSSLQEMASMTNQNAANAKEAKSMSDAARVSADKGTESMKSLSEAMTRIKSSSDETAKIVKTIDEIAFQTNLLALNAAVEAARAGDAGKGFAVVAEEVRNLAMRSAEAAKNTANMIEESVKNADSGVSINAHVLKNLSQITDQVRTVSEVMGEIAVASDQQSTGIEQITVAVDQLNQVTQQNAANSEESASTSEEMSGQVEELRTMVGSFKLTNETSARPGTPVAAETLRGTMITHGPRPVNRKVGKPVPKFNLSTAGGASDLELVGSAAGTASVRGLARDPRKLIPLDKSDEATLRQF
jgi:methyl-accepting chemotaxis protein